MKPRVTIVLSTFNRGLHILPTIRSALSQTVESFELLVIGDAVTDDTGQHVTTMGDRRLRWINLDTRIGTQSGPNNRGLDEARAPIVAYMDHEDVWAPRHLEHLLAKYDAVGGLDAVASGIALHRDNALAPYVVEGVFDDFAAFDTRSFTPPTGFSHRIDRKPVPRWKTREETLKSVDFAFQQELADLGYAFGSTGAVTVHKFIAVGNYLGYLQPESDEQARLLARLHSDEADALVEDIVATAKATGFYQWDKPWVGEDRANRSSNNDQVRGLKMPAMRPLGQGVSLSQDAGYRGLAWRPPHPDKPGLRWAGPSSKPRFLIPVTHDGPARIELDIAFRLAPGLCDFSVMLNGNPVVHRLCKHRTGRRYGLCRLLVEGALKADHPSILRFDIPKDAFIDRSAPHEAAFALGDMRVTPLGTRAARLPHLSRYLPEEPRPSFWHWLGR